MSLRIYRLEALDIVVGNRNGANIYLRDVATVTDTQQERAQESFNNGTRSGMMIIQKQTDANAVQISKKVRERLVELRKDLPSDVTVEPYIDMSDNILTIMALPERKEK